MQLVVVLLEEVTLDRTCTSRVVALEQADELQEAKRVRRGRVRLTRGAVRLGSCQVGGGRVGVDGEPISDEREADQQDDDDLAVTVDEPTQAVTWL